MIALLADARRRTRLAAFDVLTPPNPDYRAVLRAIDAPVLLVIGDTSPVVTEDLGVRREVIANAGHGVPYDQPVRLAEVVAAFAGSVR